MTSRARLGVLALVLFVVVDIALVAVAFRHTSAPPARADAAGAGSPASGPASGDPASAAETAAEGPLMLALAKDGTLLLADPGSCADRVAPSVRVSTDGGTSFQGVSAADKITEVLALHAGSADDLGFVASGPGCAAHSYTGSTLAGRFSRAKGRDLAWHLVSSDQAAVHSPDGRVDTPCVPAALSAASSVRVLCQDTRVLGTPDQGRSWVVLGRLRDASTIAFAGPAAGYALAAGPHCRHAVMATRDGGASWSQSRCLGAHPGRALAAQGDTVAVLTTRGLLRSTDAGQSWQRQASATP